ncbi:uncharacterized protein At4g15970-like [Nicotiana tabacum]|uniref:Uncharacterized protein At4g15970-like n=1 Tax=Nicotiana tabacum TaxID=4097 RepID=A0AC58SP21_TOBAC
MVDFKGVRNNKGHDQRLLEAATTKSGGLQLPPFHHQRLLEAATTKSGGLHLPPFHYQQLLEAATTKSGGLQFPPFHHQHQRLLETSTTKSGGLQLPPFHHHHYHYHQQLFSCKVIKIFILLFTISTYCLVLYCHSNTYPLESFPNSYNSFSSFSQDFRQGNILPSTSKKQSKLKQVLKEAAMADKTVIITTLNAAWTAPNSIFDLFLESFRIGNNTNSLLNHVLVVALDQTAYSRCLEIHSHCYALITNGVDFSGEAHFMSDDYLKMMWRRIDFLRIVLEMGYNFIFTDADILWFRRPFAHFYSHADFQIACDHYVHNSFNLKNAPNGGFKYVKSNNQTIQFYKFWYDSRKIYPEKHDQDVLNIIKFHPFLKKIKLKIMFLDTAYFGGFCEPSKDVNLVCTMYANCCVGLGNKIHDLKMAINDWKNYMALPSGETISKRHTWTVPRICGLKFIKNHFSSHVIEKQSLDRVSNSTNKTS